MHGYFYDGLTEKYYFHLLAREWSGEMEGGGQGGGRGEGLGGFEIATHRVVLVAI